MRQDFAQQLLDYDPIVNQGNWQWTAGSGADSQPYFRIFNPWLQSKNYDPDCEYIKPGVSLEVRAYDPIEKWMDLDFCADLRERLSGQREAVDKTYAIAFHPDQIDSLDGVENL